MCRKKLGTVLCMKRMYGKQIGRLSLKRVQDSFSKGIYAHKVPSLWVMLLIRTQKIKYIRTVTNFPDPESESVNLKKNSHLKISSLQKSTDN